MKFPKLWWGAVAGVLAIIAFVAFRYDKKPEANYTRRIYKPVTVEQKVVAGFNDFGFKLLKKQSAKGNALFSPASLSLLLAMARSGAGGQTQMEIASLLGVSQVPEAAFKKTCHDTIARWNSASDYAVTAANSIWCQTGEASNPQFLQAEKNDFDAEVSTLDLHSSQAPVTVDNWVNQKTRGKIKHIAPSQFDSDTILVLLSTMHLKSAWEHQFDVGQTREMNFHLENKEVRRVPMMFQEAMFGYCRGEDFAMLRMACGYDGYAVYILLPDEGHTVTKLAEKIDGNAWFSWQSRAAMSEGRGSVYLPRFKIESTKNFNSELESLGMKTAFRQGQADFSRMRSAKDISISLVRQAASLEVNEKGVEATAVSGLGLAKGDAPQEPFDFIADHPFLVAITDESSGLILFWGVVRAPENSTAPAP